MKTPLAKNLVKYGVSIGIGLVLAYIYVAARLDLGDLASVERVDLYLILCDGCTIPGLLLLMSGFMMTISNQGALDGVTYVLTNAVRMLIPGAATRMERYKEYVERKRENRVKGYGFLYVTALIFLILAGIFMALFYALYQK